MSVDEVALSIAANGFFQRNPLFVVLWTRKKLKKRTKSLLSSKGIAGWLQFFFSVVKS